MTDVAELDVVSESKRICNKCRFVKVDEFYQKTVMGCDGLAQWLERWTGDPKVEGSDPVRNTRTTLTVSAACNPTPSGKRSYRGCCAEFLPFIGTSL